LFTIIHATRWFFVVSPSIRNCQFRITSLSFFTLFVEIWIYERFFIDFVFSLSYVNPIKLLRLRNFRKKPFSYNKLDCLLATKKYTNLAMSYLPTRLSSKIKENLLSFIGLCPCLDSVTQDEKCRLRGSCMGSPINPDNYHHLYLAVASKFYFIFSKIDFYLKKMKYSAKVRMQNVVFTKTQEKWKTGKFSNHRWKDHIG